MKKRPQISTRSITRIRKDTHENSDDILAVEEPLQIRLQYGSEDFRQEKSLAVTMRTPGNDFELVTGFLLAESIIHSFSDILHIQHCQNVKEEERGNVVVVRLAAHVHVDLKRLERHFFTNSSCGVCGKSAIDAITCNSRKLSAGPSQKISIKLVRQLSDILEKNQTLFRHTGGLHASALFNLEGECIIVREDVGRHNAFDKVVGAATSLEMLPLNNFLVLLSGRVSFELVQKAVAAGIPILIAVGAPSSLAVELASSKGLTLIGFLRKKRFNIYTFPERIRDIGSL